MIRYLVGQAKYFVDLISWKPTPCDEAVRSRLTVQGVSFRNLNSYLDKHGFPQRFPKILESHSEMVHHVDEHLRRFLDDPQNARLEYEQRRNKLIDSIARKVAEEW